MNGGETRTDLGSEHLGASRADVWVLTVAHHADEPVIGRRRAIEPEQVLHLGRGSDELGAGTFDDAKVSRRHASFHVHDEQLTVADDGSRNGTFINGKRVVQATLCDGDVVTIGGVLLLAQRGPLLHRPLSHPAIVGVSPATSSLLHHIQVVAPTPATVLIVGETGVGKELVAHAIHQASGRPGDLVAVDCSALSDGVLQSELFGHVHGAYSGATGARQGLVEAARDGSVLLDEIGDASAALQASLLRLLEQRQYRAVGSDVVQSTAARFIAATHVDLAAAIHAGRFRADLYSRLDRWRIDVPPLRSRREDIVPLALHFARRWAGRHDVVIARSLAHALLRHSWPANARELRNVVEQACIESESATLRLSPALEARLGVDTARASVAPPPDSLPPPSASAPAAPPSMRTGRGVRRHRPDPDALRALFRDTGGNVRALSERLGVGRSTVYRWFREADIDVEELRDD